MKNKIVTWCSSDTAKVLLVVVAWQFTLLIIGALAEQIIKPAMGNFPTEPGLTSHTFRWDSGWYKTISKEFYQSSPGHEVFYPLFPLITTSLSKLSLGILSIGSAGFLLNLVSTFFAALALLKISKHLLRSTPVAWFSVFAFISLPSAFFMHAFYTEALFCALAFWAYLFALRRQWAYMAVCLGFLTATRITSILFIGLCGAEYLRSIGWNLRRLNSSVLWFALAPIGFISYALYLLRTKNDFFAMFHAYDAVPDWAYQQLNPNFLYTYLRAMKGAGMLLLNQRPLDNGSLVNTLLPALALTALLATSLYALFKIKDWAVPLGLFGLASFVFFTLNSNVVSAHRYLLPCLVVYLVVANTLRKRPAILNGALASLGLMSMAQVFLYIMFITGYFAG